MSFVCIPRARKIMLCIILGYTCAHAHAHTHMNIYIQTQKHKSIRNRLEEYTQNSCQWFLWGDGMMNEGLEVVVKDVVFTYNVLFLR